MRYDTLAQMLTLGNIRAGNKMIVMETCSGLVLGAMMERMGGFGSIIQLYPGDGPVRGAGGLRLRDSLFGCGHPGLDR